LSKLSEDDDRPRPDEEIPRQGMFSAFPKRTVSRVLLLLAALAGIIYLRQRTALIAGCMSDAFLIPSPAEQRNGPSSIKARIVPPSNSLETTP